MTRRQSIRQSFKEARKSLTRKQQKILQRKEEERKRQEQPKYGQSTSLSSKQHQNKSNSLGLSWNEVSAIGKSKDTHDSFLERMQEERRWLQIKDMQMEQVRDSHREKELGVKQKEQFYSDSSISDSIGINLNELNMNNLIRQKNSEIG